VAAIIAASGILAVRIKNASNLFAKYLQKITERKSEGLENRIITFSRHWKISPHIFQALEKFPLNFSKPWKTVP
jgi:hypothetical protein